MRGEQQILKLTLLVTTSWSHQHPMPSQLPKHQTNWQKHSHYVYRTTRIFGRHQMNLVYAISILASRSTEIKKSYFLRLRQFFFRLLDNRPLWFRALNSSLSGEGSSSASGAGIFCRQQWEMMKAGKESILSTQHVDHVIFKFPN
jgi:hypothetical protein